MDYGAALESLSPGQRNIVFIAAALALLVVAYAIFLAVSGGVQSNSSVVVSVENEAGVSVRGADVKVSGLENELNLQTDKEGKAVFEAIAGKEVQIIVSKQNYADEKKTVLVGEEETPVDVVLKIASSVSKTVTLTFAGPDSKKLDGKEISVRLSCTGTGKFSQEEFTVTTGELEIEPPENCGSINVTAVALGNAAFKTYSGTVIGRNETIRFEGIDKPKGSVRINAKDSETKGFVDGISVKILGGGSDSGIQDFTSCGQASFTLETGDYEALIEDPSGQYASESVSLSVQENSSETKEVLLSKDVKLKASVAVAEKGGKEIWGATVLLLDSENKIAGPAETGTDGKAVFAVKESGTYYIQASAENFVPSEKVSFNTSSYAKGSEQEFRIELEKCTSSKCGALRIRVVDEDGFPVENAKVLLLNEEQLVASEYGSKISDFNGFIEAFANVKPGKYYARAQKYPAEGTSGLFEVLASGENLAEVRLEIGTGIVNITAVDGEGLPIEFAQAEIITDYGQSLGTVAMDAEGKGI